MENESENTLDRYRKLDDIKNKLCTGCEMAVSEARCFFYAKNAIRYCPCILCIVKCMCSRACKKFDMEANNVNDRIQSATL